MLTLADASRYFDRTPILDPYTGALLFYAQIDPYQDAVRDSATAYRRIMSLAPGISMPASRLVKILGSVWIVGDSEIDGMSKAHREKFVLHPAPTLLGVRTLNGHVVGGAFTTSWGDMVWLKDAKEESSSSRTNPMYTAYLPTSATLNEYNVITVGTTGYLVGPPHDMASGTLSATCSKLEYGVADATLATRVYDPVLGKYTSSVDTTVKCLRVRWQSLYLYGSQGDTKYQEGDCSLVFPTGTPLATKDRVTLDAQVWSVLAVETLGGAVVAHARRG
jgi:hypothetical protein